MKVTMNRRFGSFLWEIQHFHIMCQAHFYDFWIMNGMCTFIYLFVVYCSFAPVFPASIHRYVNYFDIQDLMMVTETETLTSTLHIDIFTYLDYVFSATFIYIYIQNNKYIYICIYRKQYSYRIGIYLQEQRMVTRT